MTKYIVNFTRTEIEGHEEQKFEIPVEALDPSAAALIAGIQIFADTLATSSLGMMMSMAGIDMKELGDVAADAYKNCVNVAVTGV